MKLLIRAWLAFCALGMAQAMSAGPAGGDDSGYLFAYFKSGHQSRGDGLHLAWSRDGTTWKKLNHGRVYFKPRQGMFRDPFVLQGPDGIFRMTWTSAEKEIGYAQSSDLINWTDEKYLPVMAHEPQARNCWAPEMFYDDQKKQFLIFWSTTIPGKFPQTDPAGDQGYNHRIYYVTTKDFQTFSPTRLLFDPGFNCIDATMLKAGSGYYMFLKNETLKPVKKFIVHAQAQSPEGPWGPVSEPLTPSWSEGPTVIKIGEQWFLYYDLYAKKKYGLSVSSDLIRWQDRSAQLKMPRGARHGCVLKVSGEFFSELDKR